MDNRYQDLKAWLMDVHRMLQHKRAFYTAKGQALRAFDMQLCNLIQHMTLANEAKQ